MRSNRDPYQKQNQLHIEIWSKYVNFFIISILDFYDKVGV